VPHQVPISFQREGLIELKERILNDGPWDSWNLFKMAYRAEEAILVPDFGEMQCLKHLSHLNPFPHQIESARKVLNEMRGRAILADEVGLGKTIEAGLVLKEYMIRGLVKKALILVPSSLVLQWQRELVQKFGIPAMAQKKEYMWNTYDILIASIDTAKRSPHREHVLGQEYDLLIIDEAHKLKNPATKNYQFVKEIKKKYCLLLTATPVQNELSELYNLITLLKPGHLGSVSDFAETYVKGKRESKNSQLLKMELDKVMIRNRRVESGLHLPDRNVITVSIDLSENERRFYEAVTQFVKKQYKHYGMRSALPLITLQRELCSSKDATFLSLINIYNRLPADSPLRREIEQLAEIGKQVETHSKALKTVELIKEINDKVIIFTEFRGTLNFLQHYLHQHGITSIPFRGGFGRNKKDWMRELFEKRAQVLVATEAGGEGINLQFCNRIINYDLPWNPMKVEQRIGRIHRLGQEREVYIYNLSTTNTIEEQILKLLYEKINLFEVVIGELDTILERMPKGTSLESHMVDIFIGSDSMREMEIKMENITHVFNRLKNIAMQETIQQQHTSEKEVANWINKR
jgi:SNF2 family DNA or RNA helicase